MVTPVTPNGQLDERAVMRLVDHIRDGGAHGVFVLGTTGESPSIPSAMRSRMVELVTEIVAGRMLVYAGISDNALADAVEAGNRYVKMGVDALVAHVPYYFAVHPDDSLHYFTELASRLKGGLMLYNMPMTTRVSIPIDVCKETARMDNIIGIKDSENNPDRVRELMHELGGRENYSVFIGTGAMMAEGLLAGADGIVPSVANFAPALCRELYDCATNGGAARVPELHRRMMDVSAIYQKDLPLSQSLPALKAALSHLGLCGPDVFPPLTATGSEEREALRAELARWGFSGNDSQTDESPASNRIDNGRPGGRRAGAVPADAR
jgi:4-hydroxy-tetrahydrodipicolinate synthase